MIFRDDMQDTMAEAMIKSISQCDSQLAREFFSAQNRAAIQTGLRIIIQQKTGYTIGAQSPEQLLIIMRGLYTLNAHNNAQDMAAEIRRLNAIVLSEVAPQVGTGISQHLGYLRDASTLSEPIERARNLSVKGSNTFSLFQPL